VWHGGGEAEPELLASCHRRSLEVVRFVLFSEQALEAFRSALEH